MVSFSNDSDILKYEPVLFGELHRPGQVLILGTGGTLSGTTFTDSGADFQSANAAAGGVIHLESDDGTIDGAYEIVSVDSATQLTLSVLRADSEDDAVAVGSATNVSYQISTFSPQSRQTALELTEYFGIGPGNPASEIDAEDILDTDALATISAFAVISGVYASLASGEEDENFWQKSMYYRRLFEKARNRCRLSIDSSGDGIADIVKNGGALHLLRD